MRRCYPRCNGSQRSVLQLRGVPGAECKAFVMLGDGPEANSEFKEVISLECRQHYNRNGLADGEMRFLRSPSGSHEDASALSLSPMTLTSKRQ